MAACLRFRLQISRPAIRQPRPSPSDGRCGSSTHLTRRGCGLLRRRRCRRPSFDRVRLHGAATIPVLGRSTFPLCWLAGGRRRRTTSGPGVRVPRVHAGSTPSPMRATGRVRHLDGDGDRTAEAERVNREGTADAVRRSSQKASGASICTPRAARPWFRSMTGTGWAPEPTRRPLHGARGGHKDRPSCCFSGMVAETDRYGNYRVRMTACTAALECPVRRGKRDSPRRFRWRPRGRSRKARWPKL